MLGAGIQTITIFDFKNLITVREADKKQRRERDRERQAISDYNLI